ncbi:MAG: ABC transporter permease [Spirochaetaceae bacterium]
MESLINRLKKLLGDKPVILSYLLIFILGYLIVAPVLSLLGSAFTVSARDFARGIGDSVGEFTTHYITRTFVGPLRHRFFYTPLLNTLAVVFPVSIISGVIGSILAWLVARTNIWGKRILTTLAIIPYILPSWTYALSWITVFRNRRLGGSSGILEFFGVTVPDWLAYGGVPLVIVMAINYFPFSFLLVGGALRDVDARLEESAEVLGARTSVILRRILFSLVLPAILSAWVLTMASGVGAFGAPAFLGGPVNFHVLATRLYSAFRSGDNGVAYMLSIVMILLAVSFVYINHRFIGTRRSYVTVSGKGTKKKITDLGKWRLPATITSFVFLLSVTFLPLSLLALDTLMARSGVFTLDNLTLHYWIGQPDPAIDAGEPGVLRNPMVGSAFMNTLTLGLTVAVLCGLFGFLIGYTVVRVRKTKPWLSTTIDQVSFLPYLVPSIGFGAMYLTLFAVRRGPIPSLYGTFTLLVLITVVKNLPFATRAGISGMLQLGHEIEEAGMIAGAGWLTRMRRLILPLQKGSIVSGATLPLVTGMRELALLIMLITPGTNLLTTLTFSYADGALISHSNALLLINVFTILVFTLLIRKLSGTDISQGLRG